jgi:hypothetical protein
MSLPAVSTPATVHDCLNNPNIQELGNIQTSNRVQLTEAPIRNDNQMGSFDDWIHASCRCRNSVDGDFRVPSDPAAGFGHDPYCSLQR